MTTSPSYPIGNFVRPTAPIAAPDLRRWVDDIERLPADLRAAVAALPAGGQDRPYRDGGWTARQVAHHVADSHINSYIRFRLALTEDNPTIKPYDEASWAQLPDACATSSPVETSLALVDSLHARWSMLLRSLKPEQWRRPLVHPASGSWTLDEFAALYSWHGRHHVAHLRLIR